MGALVEAITRLRGDRELRARMSENGRAFVTARYLRSTLAEKYLNALETALAGQQPMTAAEQKPAERGSPQLTIDE